LKIDPRVIQETKGPPASTLYRESGHVTLEIKDVERDADGCVAGFTVPEQTVKVVLPQGRWPGMNIHAKRKEDPAEDPAKERQRAIEDLQRKLADPP
jgi:hypothetical protein